MIFREKTPFPIFVMEKPHVNRVTEKNGIHGGWWIDCAVAYETEHYEKHRAIHNKYLGNTLRSVSAR